MPRKATSAPTAGTNAQPAKAKAVAKPRGKGKNAKAKVCKLADVPVNVFCQIAMYLQPVDLLYLARTNKTFRRVLMKRAARNIWQAVIQNVADPLPAVPDDVSEPAWVNLVFVNICHNCLKKGLFLTYWEPRTRLCPSCRKNEERKFPPGTPQALGKHFGDLEFEEAVADTCVLELIPVMERELVMPIKVTGGFCAYRESDYEGLKRELLNASVEERTAIVQRRKASTKAIREHFLRDCVDWEYHQRDARYKDKEQAEASRRKAIIVKLRELGWGRYIDKMTYQERNGFVELREVQGGPLTDRVWSSIKEEVLDYMDMVKLLHSGPGYGGDGIKGWDGVDPLDPDGW